jgi:phosphoglycerate dehydrogenase-like enzyme
MQNQDLLSHPNVIFTPHIAFNSVEAVERINSKTIENIRAYLAGRPVNVITSADAPCSGRGSAVAPVATLSSQPADQEIR